MISKTAMITICGRPNVGKSTLANAFAGEKVAIVSQKPQTTRTRITAVCQRGETQYVFLDTPGFHKPRTKLGDFMVDVVRQSVGDVDAVVLVVEPVPDVGPQEKELIRSFREASVPAVLAINKIDTVEPERLLSVISAYSGEYEFSAVVPVSAMTGEGVEELLKELDAFAVESPALFPEGTTTDQPERQVCAELIREKLLTHLDREIPHGTAVEIEKFSERDNGIVDVEAVIYCEKASHKGIIIGKHGAMLKAIGEEARRDMEEFMGTKIYLQTWVKVKERWRDSDFLLRNFGYSDK